MRKFLIGAFGVVALATSAVAQQGQQVYACKVIDEQGNEQYICYVRQSYDPNEMSGPAGVGAERFVEAGDLMDYTIYFENTTNATAAAIKIAVTLPKDANLDWSTLELGEVVFGDHTDDGFVKDKSARSSKYALADSGCEVRTTVTEDDDSVTWNLRIWDPNTLDHFPEDFNMGVLPANDPETHCGEGHIRFSVKVKDAAAPGTVVRASASIVFDDNPAIPTDPAWFNTVATIYKPEVDLGDGTTTNLTLVVGQLYGDLPKPVERDGFAFVGWFAGPEGSGRIVTADSFVAEGDDAIHGVWTPLAVPLPVYRFYSKNYKGHFFTIDEDEMWTIRNTNRNWSFEGTAYMAFTNQVNGTVPLYRFYSKGYRGHFFTIDAEEAEVVKKNRNWEYEGVAYYVYPQEVDGSVPVFRFWSNGYRHHFYTINESEKDTLIATNPNWAYEGVAFYALSAETVESGVKSLNKSVSSAAVAVAGEETRSEGRIPGNGSSVAAKSGASLRTASRVNASAAGATAGDEGLADAAPWTLWTRDGTPIKRDGATELDAVVVESRLDAPDAAELRSAETAEGDALLAETPPVELSLRLSGAPATRNATLWSASDGTVSEDDFDGTLDFDLPATGVWHWLRAADDSGNDSVSVWLRATAD